MLKLIKTSVIGPGHISDNLPNQDAIGHFITGQHWAIVVCDGMGSRVNADIGSVLAVQLIKTVLKKSDFNASPKTVITEFYQLWLNTLKKRAIKANDAVTTVLIAWGNNKGNFRTFQLGDGVISSKQQVYSPESSDDFSNITTGLGLSKDYSDWVVGSGVLSKKNNTLLLMSDGISEDITDHCAFTEALESYSLNKSSRRVKKHLKNMLINWPTPFHTDDKSLTMVILNDKK
ncbi:PP2C family serine/threonine-protein phosphatase [Colwellia sp. 12G3]|uniref:PP2C family serine/threonine-protein phosphatase n=1 Tax=Colwellia sp. 12G3 TaxID=2058299 RepID=UPI000C3468CA|nr:PP2C family serine/threonine-protein phosphatase [Colwellia sp. 12G3]PKI12711.1 protein phosphatase 2C domain-containing protein [Colwellia sp. 12G3]